MSYHQIAYRKYEVRWRDEHGKNRSRRINGTEAQARALDEKIKAMKRDGTIGQVTMGRQTFQELAEDVWERRYSRLEAKTREGYAWLLDRYIVPRFGRTRLSQITADGIERWVADMEAEGVGRSIQIKALKLLSRTLKVGTQWGRLPTNPAAVVPPPRPAERTEVRPLPPTTWNAIRENMIGIGAHESALLVSLMAGAGLRPGEALGLTWGHVREATLLVEQVASKGEILKRTKTRKSRSVQLLEPIAADLAAYKLRVGSPPDDHLIFSMQRRPKTPWTEETYANWRRRVFYPAATAAGVPDATPYHLRHSFASLLLWEGMNPLLVARQMGHSPAMLFSTYAHVIDEIEFTPGQTKTAVEAIREARRSGQGVQSAA